MNRHDMIPEDRDDGDFFTGVAWALPLSIFLWSIIVLLVVWAMK